MRNQQQLSFPVVGSSLVNPFLGSSQQRSWTTCSDKSYVGGVGAGTAESVK
jgi:hypothetical protein